MPVLQARTRTQLRQSIGSHLGARVSTASAQGTTTTLKDNTLTLGAADEHKGKWIIFTSGTAANVGLVRQVTASSIASNVTTLTFAPSATQTESADGYELWPAWFEPVDINRFINDAIIHATERAFDPVESLALHADGSITRFDIPSGLSFLTRIDYRRSFTSLDIHRCNAVWTESVDSDVTASKDDEDYKEGGASLKLVVVAAASVGDILATHAITSKDLSGYDYVEFWIKSTIVTAANDLQLLLDNTASCASPLETLNVPALVADTWTFVRVALANPELDTAIISVGLKYAVDIGAVTLWLDDIRGVKNNSAAWRKVDNSLWRIDKESQDIVFDKGGVDYIGYALLKLVGGDKLALLNAEATATELSEEYIVAYAVGQALLSKSGGAVSDPDARRQLGMWWMNEADKAKARLPLLIDVRPVA